MTATARRTYRPIVKVFFVGNFVAAAILTGLLTARTTSLSPNHVASFALFAILALIAELRPLDWLGPNGKVKITASPTFLLGLFLVAPIPTAGLAASAVVLLAYGWRRGPLVSGLFNIGQIVLSLEVGFLITSWLGFRPLEVAGGRFGPLWWAIGALASGLLAIGVNLVLAGTASDLDNQASFITVMRASLSTSLILSVSMICLAPIMVVLTASNFALGILLTATIFAIYRTSDLALKHEHEATHDLLTSLANRRSLYAQAELSIAAAHRKDQQLSVLQIDLDGFKGINDRLGQAVGDKVLKAVALRLLEGRRAGDVVSRIGGDEFVVILPSTQTSHDATEAAAQILRQLRLPLVLDGVPLTIDASIGIAQFPEHGEDINTLLSNADTALYRSKKAKNGPELYTDEHNRSGPVRMTLAGEMLRAMEKREFFLAYQPKLDLVSQTFVGVEALIRWNHPTRGVLYPDAFITTAEQTDLMQPLTEYVLERALQQCSLWHAEGLFLTMAVNVSARNLHDHDFVVSVANILRLAEVDPMWLELELTENTVMVNPERTARVLEDLRKLGIQIALDDFGTGFSSLANLRTLPIDRVKIDKTFVFGMLHSLKDESIVRSIIDLAKNLGLGTVAEGVESLEVLTRLEQLGCETVQGYYIGKPISAIEIRNMCHDGGLSPMPLRGILP